MIDLRNQSNPLPSFLTTRERKESLKRIISESMFIIRNAIYITEISCLERKRGRGGGGELNKSRGNGYTKMKKGEE